MVELESNRVDADRNGRAPHRWMSLADYGTGGYQPGGTRVSRGLWYLVSLIVFESGWLPFYGVKRGLLRWFGASVGKNVVIKPRVRIKYPWRLVIGDHSWIGEDVWIDNLANVRIGRDVCVSQGVYLCTGSHDSRRVTFDLIVAPIDIGDEAWIAARSVLLPGVAVARGAVVAAGSVVTASVSVSAGSVLAGVPARVIGIRCSPREDSAGHVTAQASDTFKPHEEADSFSSGLPLEIDARDPIRRVKTFDHPPLNDPFRPCRIDERAP